MRQFLLGVAAVAVLAGGVTQARAEETWKGTITDSMCGVKHSADKHGEKAADHKACVERCIGRGGEYVLVAGDKVYKIANQKFDGLKPNAGAEVVLTGEMKDETITVSKIEPAKAEKK